MCYSKLLNTVNRRGSHYLGKPWTFFKMYQKKIKLEEVGYM